MALTKVTGSVIKDSVSLSGNVSVGGTLTYPVSYTHLTLPTTPVV